MTEQGSSQGARPTPSAAKSLAQAGRQGGTAVLTDHLQHGGIPGAAPQPAVQQPAAPPRRRGAGPGRRSGRHRATGLRFRSPATRPPGAHRCCAAAAAARAALRRLRARQGGRQQACLRRAGHAVLAGGWGSTMAASPASGLSRRPASAGTEVLHQQLSITSGSSLRAPLCGAARANRVRRPWHRHRKIFTASTISPSLPGLGAHQADLTHVGLATGVGAAGPVGTHRFRQVNPSLQLPPPAPGRCLWLGSGQSCSRRCRCSSRLRPAGAGVRGGSAAGAASASSAWRRASGTSGRRAFWASVSLSSPLP